MVRKKEQRQKPPDIWVATQLNPKKKDEGFFFNSDWVSFWNSVY